MKKTALVFDVDETITKDDTIFRFYDLYGMKGEGEQLYEWSKNSPGKIEKKYGVPSPQVYPSVDAELIIKQILDTFGPIPISQFRKTVDASGFATGAREFFNFFSAEPEYEIFFITSMYSPSADYIAQTLRVAKSNVFSTKLTVERGNAIAFKGPVMDSKIKVTRGLGQILRRGYSLIKMFGFGDSSSDAPFISTIVSGGGIGIAVRENPALAKICKYVQKEPDFFELKRIVLKESEKWVGR